MVGNILEKLVKRAREFEDSCKDFFKCNSGIVALSLMTKNVSALEKAVGNMINVYEFLPGGFHEEAKSSIESGLKTLRYFYITEPEKFRAYSSSAATLGIFL